MDGLSTAASGIAIASLTIQLVDSVRRIHRFLRNVTDAPKELKRLLDLLEQLELILDNIFKLIEQQRIRYPTRQSCISESVLQAIKNCDSSISRLEKIVELTNKTHEATTKTARSFGSFKFACKKKEIEDFEARLRQAINLLDLTMTMNLTDIQSHNTDMIVNAITTTVKEQMLLFTKNAAGTIEDTRRTNISSGIIGHRSQEKIHNRVTPRNKVTTSSRRYRGLFGTLVIFQKHETMKLDELAQVSTSLEKNKEESIWMLTPSFCSHCIEIKLSNAFGAPQGSLRIRPIIPDDHPVWDMCLDRDMIGLQALFDGGFVSPFSINSDGKTLLHKATLFSQAKTCSFLIRLGLSNQDRDDNGWAPSHLICLYHLHVSKWQRTFGLEDLCRLFANQLEYEDMADACPGLFAGLSHNNLMCFNQLIDIYVTKENANSFTPPPLQAALLATVYCDRNRLTQWRDSIRKLLALQPNIFEKQDGNSRCRIFHDILWRVDNPFDSQEVGDLWLDILHENGVDVAEDVQRMVETHTTHPDDMPMIKSRSGLLRKLVVSQIIGIWKVSWDWHFDPAGRAFDVLQEFRNFNQGSDTYPLYLAYLQQTNFWPYRYYAWHYYAELIEFDTYRQGHQLATQRFERRWHKKAAKIARAQGIRPGPRVPGAWID